VVTGRGRPHGIVLVAGNDPGNFRQMNDGLSDCGAEIQMRPEALQSAKPTGPWLQYRVPLNRRGHLLQIGADVNHAGRLA